MADKPFNIRVVREWTDKATGEVKKSGTTIGVAWKREDGGFNCDFYALPADKFCQILPPFEESDTKATE